MIDFPILSMLLAIPILGILFMSLIRANNTNSERNLKQTALWISFLNFLASLLLLLSFDLNNPEFHKQYEKLLVNVGQTDTIIGYFGA